MAIASTDVDETAIDSVIETVATREGVAPTELEPLYTAVGPGITESLVRLDDGAESSDGGELSFTYYGYDVTVEDDGAVQVAGEA